MHSPEILDGLDPHHGELGHGGRASAMQFADGEWRQESRPVFRGNHEEPSGLAPVGGELRKQLVVGHPRRSG